MLAFRSVGFFYVVQPSSYEVERTPGLVGFRVVPSLTFYLVLLYFILFCRGVMVYYMMFFVFLHILVTLYI
jgi:hypothetical protein